VSGHWHPGREGPTGDVGRVGRLEKQGQYFD
jgi:hypothetical protein